LGPSAGGASVSDSIPSYPLLQPRGWRSVLASSCRPRGAYSPSPPFRTIEAPRLWFAHCTASCFTHARTDSTQQNGWPLVSNSSVSQTCISIFLGHQPGAISLPHRTLACLWICAAPAARTCPCESHLSDLCGKSPRHLTEWWCTTFQVLYAPGRPGSHLPEHLRRA
jgi:hypothetical protein